MASSLYLIQKIERLKKSRDVWKAERRRKPRTDRRSLRRLRLGKFIPAISSDRIEPTWLRPHLVKLELLDGGRLRICVSVPPRHGKSDSILHWIAWALTRNPKLQILYATHTASFARTQSRVARRLAIRAGVQLSAQSNRQDEWETTAGGGLVARGIGGEIMGRGFDVIIVDDPVKGIREAGSAAARDAVYEWLTGDVFNRLTPDGSILVVHTRWHVDDLIGRLTKPDAELKFERLNIPAIAENDNDPLGRQTGEVLWPEKWPVEVLDERRKANAYAWAALYQGRPRPRGGQVFSEPTFYDNLPTTGYRVGYGLDLSYTAKTYADFSVLIRGYVVTDVVAGKPRRRLYITQVWRRQCEAPAFSALAKTALAEKRGPILWYASGTERGSAQFFRQQGVPVVVRNASTDKYQRAQPLAASWNQGNVLVPSDSPDWLVDLLGEVSDFTGVGDRKDDQVDALAALHDLLMKSGGSSGGGAAANDDHYRAVA